MPPYDAPAALDFGPGHPLYVIVGVFVFVTGACIGSFLNVVIWRVPRGESIVTAPSHCPKCGHKIRPWENVPIFGWLLLRGKCSGCKAPISGRYPTVETLTAILFLATWIRGWNRGEPLELTVAWLIIMALLVAVTYIDFDYMIIPDGINLTGFIAAVVLAIGWPGSHQLSSTPNYLSDLNHKPVLHWIVGLLMDVWQPIIHHKHLLSMVDLIAGAVLGYGALWLIVEIGKLTFGRRHVRTYDPVTFTLTATTWCTDEEDDDGDGLFWEFLAWLRRRMSPTDTPPADKPGTPMEPEEWDELLLRKRDRLTIRGALLEATGKDGKPLLEPSEGTAEYTITEKDGLALPDGRQIPLADLGTVRLRTTDWTEPREVMGLGDVKLLGMLGAFLGPGGALFILAMSSLLGAVGGTFFIVFGRGKLHSKIPYGPYIALAAMLYILYGEEITVAYARFVLGFLRG